MFIERTYVANSALLDALLSSKMFLAELQRLMENRELRKKRNKIRELGLTIVAFGKSEIFKFHSGTFLIIKKERESVFPIFQTLFLHCNDQIIFLYQILFIY